jgi:hypothetical protein
MVVAAEHSEMDLFVVRPEPRSKLQLVGYAYPRAHALEPLQR